MHRSNPPGRRFGIRNEDVRAGVGCGRGGNTVAGRRPVLMGAVPAGAIACFSELLEAAKAAHSAQHKAGFRRALDHGPGVARLATRWDVCWSATLP